MLTGVPVIAVAGTRLAECAGPGKYFDVVDAVMRGQKDYYAWGESNIIAQPILVKIAASFGMNETAFNACAGDSASLARLQQAHKSAIESGIRSTPSLFVNGKELERHDLDSLEAAIKTAK
jgi:protein-disulfide isomerase